MHTAQTLATKLWLKYCPLRLANHQAKWTDSVQACILFTILRNGRILSRLVFCSAF